jgi:PAS domain S-box-containing protein
MEENKIDEMDYQAIIKQYERDIRKLNREITHLNQALSREKTAYTTVLNQQKASTFIMRERERYLMLLLANSPNIIIFLSKTGRIEFCTEYFAHKCGYKSSTEVLGHTLEDILADFHSQTSGVVLQETRRQAINEDTPISFETSFSFTKDEREEDFDGLVVPMNDSQQNNSGIILLFHDITDLKRSREEALAASHAKGMFLSSMSHEIRTPLNAIIGMTGIGKSAAELERKDYCFIKIEDASKHLLSIINDILDMSKIESGKFELSASEFNFEDMINQVVNVMNFRVDEKKQNLSLQFDPNIPQYLIGDEHRLTQVIINLLGNAVKFTAEQGLITLKTQLIDEQDDICTIQVSVKDTGIGIAPEQQARLFVSFQQADASMTRRFGGTGLGLVISKSIVEMMGGSVWIESELGVGSTFAFTVRVQKSLTKGTALKAETSDVDTAITFTGQTILLAEDVEINREIVLALLEPLNLKIDCAHNGVQAVHMIQENPQKYQLILMDVMMPEMDGYEATKQIRQLNIPQAQTIPIIAMTANVFKEDVQQCLDAGMNGHIGKPIDLAEIIRQLKLYLTT